VAARADDAAEIAQAAALAPDEAALSRLAMELAARVDRLAAEAEPERLEAVADALGELVARARELDAGADPFQRFVVLGSDLAARTRDVRERLEERAGEDETALEALFRSSDWQRLDYSEAMLGYWTGWSQLSLGQRLPSGPERRTAMERAQLAFARSALELRLPRIATASLFGLAVARHDLGDLEGARRALERVERQLALSEDPALLGPALYELASVALEQDDVERGRAVAARIPAEALSREQRLVLMRLEAEAWLRRARAGRGGAEPAAALLRKLALEGGVHAEHAAALALRHWELLRGRDLGGIGDLLAAEDAFDARRYSEARDAYARVLAQPDAVPGLDLATTRFKYARCLAESGSRGAALEALERLLSDGAGASVRPHAAALYHSLAEELASADPGPAAEARALRAATILLDVAPEAPGADIARYRVARARETTRGSRVSLAELEKIPPSSPAYPAARMDLARLRSARLQGLDASGRAGTAAGRSAARELAADLDALQALLAEGRLEPEPARDAALAVFRAKAAAWSGDPAARVLAWVERAEAQPGLDAEGRRALIRLRLRVLVQAQDYAVLEDLLAARSDDEVLRDWPIWYEALVALSARSAPAPTLLAWHARLEPLAPAPARDALALGHGRALLATGRADEASAQARALVDRDARSGDAWLLYARALDASGAAGEAFRAWRSVARGVEVGTPRWLEAQLAAAAAARRAGDLENACRGVADVVRAAPELDARARAQLETLAEGCPPPTSESDTRAAPARSGGSDSRRDPP
jgi:hypothetical protein